MLCVLGELCFLLPDLFVTRDALPVYAAHLGALRAVLGARAQGRVRIQGLTDRAYIQDGQK